VVPPILQSFHAIFSGYSAHVWPKARFEFFVDERKSFLGTEDVMDQIAHVRVRHYGFSFSVVRFADYFVCSSKDPSDKSLGYFHVVRFADSFDGRARQGNAFSAI
jgi:hypothetical protein